MILRLCVLAIIIFSPSYILAKEEVLSERRQQKSIIIGNDKNDQDTDQDDETQLENKNFLDNSPNRPDTSKTKISYVLSSENLKKNVNVVTDFFSKDAPTQTPAPNDEKTAPITKGEDKKSDPNAPAQVEDNSFEIFKSSLMFSSDEIYKINKAITDHSTGGNFNILNSNDLSQLTGQSEKQGVIISPAIYLNSIIYLSDKDWKVWLNGKLKTNETTGPLIDEALGKVSLLKITDKYCIFELVTPSLNTISPSWQSKLIRRSAGDYASADGNIRVIKDNEIVRFTLNVNQTFVALDMQIVEGFKKPVEININEKK